MIQLTHRGAVFERDAAWEAASRMFAERHYMVLPKFVEGGLLQRITRLLAEGEFAEREDKTKEGHVFAREVALGPNTPVPRLFRLLLNNPRLFAPIQKLVDCAADRFPSRKDVDGRVSCFESGRCFKFMPGRDHFDTWHGDVAKGRLVGMSVNLESDPTAAGGLEIRLRQRCSAAHRVVPGFGDAVLFRIAGNLEHRGLPPAGTVPRCTFSGWFVAGRHYREVLEATFPAEATVPAAAEQKPPGTTPQEQDTAAAKGDDAVLRE